MNQESAAGTPRPGDGGGPLAAAVAVVAAAAVAGAAAAAAGGAAVAGRSAGFATAGPGRLRAVPAGATASAPVPARAGRAGSRLPGRGRPPFRPVRVGEVELAEPLPDLPGGTGALGVPYGAERVLVRLHGVPVGTVEVGLPDPSPTGEPTGVPATSLADAIVRHLAGPVAAHLRADGLLPPSRDGAETETVAQLLATGIPSRAPSGAEPPCSRRTALGPGTPMASVVIATRRRPEHLVRCVESVLAGDHPRMEVVVADNDPADPATRVALQARFGSDPRVRYVAQPKPGTSQARNAGIAAAAGDVIAFTDDDVTVDRRWLRTLTAALVDHPDAGCVTGLTEPAALETPAQVSFERFAGYVGGYVERTFRLDMRPRPTRLHPWVLGMAGATNNMAMWATTARAVRFDTRLGPGTPTRGGEDLDVLARLLLGGREVVYCPGALARHEHRSDDNAMRRQAFGYGSGATAVVAKWFVIDRTLRRALRRGAVGVLRSALLGETRPGVAPEERVPVPVRLHQIAGFVAGPVLWARSALQRPPW